jgi:FSR family fosmidomycin resistance protein-like MFS transporter
LLDELVFGAREAAWPLIRDDLSLSYGEIGLLLAIPAAVSAVVEPVLGVVAVAWRRRALVLGGGLAFAGALALAAVAHSAWLLLLAFALLYPASGAFVSLSQASLMDLEPERREHNMARWTVAGATGAIVGPLLVGAAAWAGLGWRGLFAAFAVATLGFVLAHRPAHGFGSDAGRLRIRDALRALARREVLRWLLLLELSDLLLDVFLGLLALYLVDESGASAATAGLAVAVAAGAGLAGSAAAIPLLRRVDGLRYLRVSAVAAGLLFAGFLLVPGTAAKLGLVAALALATAGWYPVLQARLYEALDGPSGLVLTANTLVPLYAVLPIAIALTADRFGLAAALWPLLAAPAALLLLVPRRRA